MMDTHSADAAIHNWVRISEAAPETPAECMYFVMLLASDPAQYKLQLKRST